jgi:hypothetical protein
MCGRLANLAGLPCFVRAVDYRSDVLQTTVQVRASHLYTVVTVNRIEVYFNRLTGACDGVGLRPGGGYPWDGARQSSQAAESAEMPGPRARTEI